RFTRSPWYSLPDHLSRFRVRAAKTLTARLFLAAWDYSLRLNQLGVRSQALWRADLPTHRPTPLPREQPSPGRATLLRHPFGLPTTGLGRGLGGLVPKDLPTLRA